MFAQLPAQACEVPVIATRIGGIPDVVSDSETGFLSELGDVEKMSADTMRLLTDESLRREFGERGRELREFIEKDLQEEGVRKSVVVVATSDQPPLVRMRGAYIASTAVESPVFQAVIVDVETGVIVTTASTAGRDAAGVVRGPGEIEIRFAHLPLRPRQYVVRLSITDAYQLASYDVVTAGPRFAIAGHGAGVDSLADEQDGLVTVPFDVVHRHP